MNQLQLYGESLTSFDPAMTEFQTKYFKFQTKQTKFSLNSVILIWYNVRNKLNHINRLKKYEIS